MNRLIAFPYEEATYTPGGSGLHATICNY